MNGRDNVTLTTVAMQLIISARRMNGRDNGDNQITVGLRICTVDFG
jgi:hypothetical protein